MNIKAQYNLHRNWGVVPKSCPNPGVLEDLGVLCSQGRAQQHSKIKTSPSRTLWMSLCQPQAAAKSWLDAGDVFFISQQLLQTKMLVSAPQIFPAAGKSSAEGDELQNCLCQSLLISPEAPFPLVFTSKLKPKQFSCGRENPPPVQRSTKREAEIFWA